ncbi:MAG: type I methionyl aminopeptidase, partial [Parcubacteria group bacterium SW_4_46_8]
MIQTKTSEEIDTLKAGGNRLSQVMGKILEAVDVGTQTGTLEEIARKEIKRLNGEAAFLDYQPARANRPYPGALCVSLNDEIVHGMSVPSRELTDGDVVTFDIGFEYKDLIT